ncbi:MAG: haloacid dehalogenase-like hydrolase [Phycisphaeraceae bacterium]|nr:haloacid dehalogenase-like hydrolase [Phycisphaeraceae bacterium]
MSTTVNASDRDRPLCVDMDGTLLAADTMMTSIRLLLRSRPWMVVALGWWMLGGLVHFKRHVAMRITLDPEKLPWRPQVIEFVKQQRAAGRLTVLATASNIKVARQMADYLGCFDRIIATDDGENLRGQAKMRAIREQLGVEAYDYIGDSKMDLPVWRQATQALLVAPRPHVRELAEQAGNVTRVFAE